MHRAIDTPKRGAWRIAGRFAALLLAGATVAAPATRMAASPSPRVTPVVAYQAHCLGCHGESGRGDGPAASILFPPPRDFASERFRLRSTRSGSPPSDADLMAVLARGVPGSAMPSFAFLPTEQRQALVEFVKSLSPRFAADTATELPLPANPPADSAATRAAGRIVYDRLACASCHGVSGNGDGPAATSLRDDRQRPIRPRDLVIGPYKGGASIRDIYLRLSTGMDGTPMRAVTDAQASQDERWQLATYVASLAAAGAGENNDSYVITAARSRGPLPVDDPSSPAWNVVPATTVTLFPLALRRTPPTPLSVRALRNDHEVAVLLEWTDATRDDDTAATDRFADAAAVQLVPGNANVFVGMGTESAPVWIWHWRADWQRELEGRHAATPRSDADSHDAPYPFPTWSAHAADNPFARRPRSTAVEEGMARGAASFTPAAVQRTNGIGVWHDGRWSLVLSRAFDRDTALPKDGSAFNVAFAVWDGGSQERGGHKAVSSWYRLALSRR